MKTKEEIEKLVDEIYGEYSGYHKASFVNGYTQCQEDMADKKYTEEDLRQAMIVALVSNSVKGSADIEDYINSLNKKD